MGLAITSMTTNSGTKNRSRKISPEWKCEMNKTVLLRNRLRYSSSVSCPGWGVSVGGRGGGIPVLILPRGEGERVPCPGPGRKGGGGGQGG